MPANKTETSSWIEKSAGVCGGEPCIRSTRHTVAGLVQWRRAGLSDDRILQHHPGLTQADLDAAWEYYSSPPDEIDTAIKDDLEAWPFADLYSDENPRLGNDTDSSHQIAHEVFAKLITDDLLAVSSRPEPTV